MPSHRYEAFFLEQQIEDLLSLGDIKVEAGGWLGLPHPLTLQRLTGSCPLYEVGIGIVN